MAMGAHHSVEARGATGWLATFPLGCCASDHSLDGELDALPRNNAAGLCDEQPRSLRPLLLHPSTFPPSTHRSTRQWVSSRRHADRPWTSSSSKPKLVISAPTDFRHIDGSDAPPVTTLRRKPSFRPLQLSIYLPENRLSPLPDFARASWDRKPDGLAVPGQALVRTRTDSVCSASSGFFIPRKPIPSFVAFPAGEDPSSLVAVHPALKRASTAPLAERRPPSTDADAASRLPQPPAPPHSRSATAPSSITLRRRPSSRTARNSVDDAISELNSIVEERRAKQAGGGAAAHKTHHVPAIAPNLRMHVRSETLSDIGSALSVPFVSKPLPTVPSSPIAEADAAVDASNASILHREHSQSQPDLLTSFPTPPPPPPPPSAAHRNRLALWIRRSKQQQHQQQQQPQQNTPLISVPYSTISTSPLPLPRTTPTTSDAPPFYKCIPTATTTTHSTPSIPTVSVTPATARPSSSPPASPRSLSFPSFGAHMAVRERHCKSMSAADEDTRDAKDVVVAVAVPVAERMEEREEVERLMVGPTTVDVAPPPVYQVVDPMAGRVRVPVAERLSAVGLAF